MPIRAARSIVKKLSFYYYDYGQVVSCRTYLLLTISLSFISYFSYPVIHTTELDSCWHASAHVEFSNFSSFRHSPSTFLITEQIRMSQPDQDISFELLQQAHAIQETIINDPMLSTVCYKYKDKCLVHAPPMYETEQEWRSKTTYINHTQVETHPYSVYANATFDQHGRFIKADAILLTFVLNQVQHGNVWNRILQQVKIKHRIKDVVLKSDVDATAAAGMIWSASLDLLPHMIQYKFSLFPFDISSQVQFSILAYMITFYIISVLFEKTNRVKSGYSFGLAAVFLSIACFTTTLGICDKLGISFHSVSLYLLLFVINIGCLENIFLLTNAVLNAGCDMTVKDKISHGLQSVGVPMTATLIAESLILRVGTYMDSDLIQEFCTFIQIAIAVEFFLNATFIIAVLSIDIKRVELADLDDRQIAKRLHETTTEQIQDTEDKPVNVETKEIKTHRIFNAFMLCSMLLLLSLLCTHHHPEPTTTHPPDLTQLSDQFWSTVNPQKDMAWLQIQPPHLFIFDTDMHRIQSHISQLHTLYLLQSSSTHYHHPSLFRILILSSLERICVLLLKINVPALILCLVMLAIITWMTPKWRKQWLVPLLIHCFNQFFLTVFKYFPIKRWYSVYITREFDATTIVSHNVRTLKHQHVSDIQSMDAINGSLVSCGHDGRIVLWNTTTWTARLDKLYPTRSGELVAQFNNNKKQNKKKTMTTTLHKQKPRLVKMDGGVWVAVVYDDSIRVWNMHTGTLVNELRVKGRTTSIAFIASSSLVSAHKTGLLHEWDIESGDCVQTIHVGRTASQLHVQERYLFTTSRDGCVQCWERRQDGMWMHVYTIQQKSAVTSIATTVGVVVTGCSEGTVNVWHFETGELLCTLYKEHQEDEYDDEEDEQCASVVQVVVTRYCQMEYGVGLCCGGDTCNGFLVACSTSDDTVHAWRLERSKPSTEECLYKRRHYVTKDTTFTQLLRSTYLGKIDQPHGRGIVFCDKTLAGVRRMNGRWEAWFASFVQHNQPLETFDLDLPEEEDEEETQKSYLKSTLLALFSSSYEHHHHQMAYKGNIHADSEMMEGEDDLDASENLPFSAIRHVVSLDGIGLACDFGNFIKLVYPTKCECPKRPLWKKTV